MCGRWNAHEKSLTQDRHMRANFHAKNRFHEKFMSDWFGTIPQHENSSRNSILTTRSFRNWPKFRNYEKHHLSDKTASPASWGTLKFKFRCWRSKSYKSRRRCERLTRYLDLLRQHRWTFLLSYHKLTDNIWILTGMAKRLVVAQRDYVRKLNEICSTSLPGGNQIDGLPPVSSEIFS